MKTLFTLTADNFILVGKVSDDLLKLYIDVEGKGKPVTRDQILFLLKGKVREDLIEVGVIDDIIKHLPQEKKVEARRIAKGKAPEIGADGKVLYLVRRYTGQTEVKVDERGYAKFNDLSLFDNVLKGQVFGRIYRPKPGVDGFDATGAPLKGAAGKPAKEGIDKTVKLQPDQDYDLLIAECDGYVAEEQGKITIKTELLIKSDLDYRFGNISFVGSVKVSGDVMPGFSITAGTGIEVNGSVRSGSLICKNGDIVVKGFVFGGEKSKIIAGKSFTASVLQEVNAEITGNIIVLKESRASSLRTQGVLQMPKGQLVGGRVYCVCGVEGKVLGAEGGTRTDVHLCSDVETSTEFSNLLLDIENHDKAITLIRLHLGPLADNPARIQVLNPPHREKMTQFLQKLRKVEESRKSLIGKKEEMLKAARVNTVFRVNVHDVAYDGVAIFAGESVFDLKEAIRGPKSIDYNVAEKKFTVGDLKALECTVAAPPPVAPPAQGSRSQNQGEKK